MSPHETDGQDALCAYRMVHNKAFVLINHLFISLLLLCHFVIVMVWRACCYFIILSVIFPDGNRSLLVAPSDLLAR